jgi:hypothetical protein
MSRTCSFGPFGAIPSELIRSAGFGCRVCHQSVERFAQAVPYFVPRMIFHACKCGCVVTWEDENQPGGKQWRGLVSLMQNRGVDVVMFNGNRPLSAGFSGLN